MAPFPSSQLEKLHVCSGGAVFPDGRGGGGGGGKGGGSRDSDASATWKNRFQILLGRVLGGAVDTPEIDGWPSMREHNSMIYRLV